MAASTAAPSDDLCRLCSTGSCDSCVNERELFAAVQKADQLLSAFGEQVGRLVDKCRRNADEARKTLAAFREQRESEPVYRAVRKFNGAIAYKSEGALEGSKERLRDAVGRPYEVSGTEVGDLLLCQGQRSSPPVFGGEGQPGMTATVGPAGLPELGSFVKKRSFDGGAEWPEETLSSVQAEAVRNGIAPGNRQRLPGINTTSAGPHLNPLPAPWCPARAPPADARASFGYGMNPPLPAPATRPWDDDARMDARAMLQRLSGRAVRRERYGPQPDSRRAGGRRGDVGADDADLDV